MSSKRKLRRKKCEGKTRYTTRDSAWCAARKLKKTLAQNIRAYKCKFCKGWHIGHTPKKNYYRYYVKGA